MHLELQKSTLQPPINPETPVFMVANSTGIAPFRAFLQERDLDLKNGSISRFGKSVLLFGCRHRDHDYLFSDEFEDQCSRNVLTAIFEAFSRDEVF